MDSDDRHSEGDLGPGFATAAGLALLQSMQRGSTTCVGRTNASRAKQE
jgi:hypothetical protein